MCVHVCVFVYFKVSVTNMLLHRREEEAFRHASLCQATNLSVCVFVCIVSSLGSNIFSKMRAK